MTECVLCADDYGLSEPVSRGILELVDMGRLSAVSCMTEGPFWQDRQNRLPSLRREVDIGLHLNLTFPFGAPKAALRRVLLGRLGAAQLEDSLNAQLDRFEAVMDTAPDFVDGHQHVHEFPAVRATLLEVLSRRYAGRLPWIRRIHPSLAPGRAWVKRAGLALLGAGFHGRAQARGFRMNPHFAGIYSLAPDADFGALFMHWLADAKDGTLIMCHPGHRGSETSGSRALEDPIAATRAREWAWLASDAFGGLLRSGRVRLVRHPGAQAALQSGS